MVSNPCGSVVMGHIAAFLVNNPLVLIGLVVLIWAIHKAVNRPPNRHNDPPDPENDWSNEDEMDRWL